MKEVQGIEQNSETEIEKNMRKKILIVILWV